MSATQFVCSPSLSRLLLSAHHCIAFIHFCRWLLCQTPNRLALNTRMCEKCTVFVRIMRARIIQLTIFEWENIKKTSSLFISVLAFLFCRALNQIRGKWNIRANEMPLMKRNSVSALTCAVFVRWWRNERDRDRVQAMHHEIQLSLVHNAWILYPENEARKFDCLCAHCVVN